MDWHDVILMHFPCLGLKVVFAFDLEVVSLRVSVPVLSNYCRKQLNNYCPSVMSVMPFRVDFDMIYGKPLQVGRVCALSYMASYDVSTILNVLAFYS